MKVMAILVIRLMVTVVSLRKRSTFDSFSVAVKDSVKDSDRGWYVVDNFRHPALKVCHSAVIVFGAFWQTVL